MISGDYSYLIDDGPMVHLSTINADGSPEVSLIWLGLDGYDLVSGHMGRCDQVRNIERDPRVVLSFDAPPQPGLYFNPYVVLHCKADVERGVHAWDLLNRLAKVYKDPDAEFPAPRGPGFLVRYNVRRVTGEGPWAPGQSFVTLDGP